MIQLALWVQTVITFNKRPALVVGFEGKNNKDHERRQQVLSYNSTGVDQNKKVLIDVVSDKAVLKKVKKKVLVGYCSSKAFGMFTARQKAQKRPKG